jgi:hypothetical protein
MTVTLERATADKAPVLSNLLELYIHDLSGIFPVELRTDGSFGYARLPLHWAEPDTRFLTSFAATVDSQVSPW